MAEPVAEPVAAPEPVAALLIRQRASLWRYLRWLGADASLADDLVQETFLRLLRHGIDADEPRLAVWLRTTARHQFVDTARRARTGVPIDDAAALEECWQRCTGDEPDRRTDALAACVATLPERARQILTLRYRHDLDLAAIAAATGLALAGVKTVLRRARADLQRCVRDRLEGTQP